MAQLVSKVSYVLTVDTDELRLILSSLIGTLKPDQLRPAEELQVKLSEQRAQILRQVAAQADRYAADAKGGGK